MQDYSGYIEWSIKRFELSKTFSHSKHRLTSRVQKKRFETILNIFTKKKVKSRIPPNGKDTMKWFLVAVLLVAAANARPQGNPSCVEVSNF